MSKLLEEETSELFVNEFEKQVEKHLKRNDLNINQQWNILKTSITSTCKNVLGPPLKREKNEWFNDKCAGAI